MTCNNQETCCVANAIFREDEFEPGDSCYIMFVQYDTSPIGNKYCEELLHGVDDEKQEHAQHEYATSYSFSCIL